MDNSLPISSGNPHLKNDEGSVALNKILAKSNHIKAMLKFKYFNQPVRENLFIKKICLKTIKKPKLLRFFYCLFKHLYLKLVNPAFKEFKSHFTAFSGGTETQIHSYTQVMRQNQYNNPNMQKLFLCFRNHVI